MTSPQFRVRFYVNGAVAADDTSPAGPGLAAAVAAAARRAAAADAELVPWLVTVDDGQTVVGTGTDPRCIPPGAALLPGTDAIAEVVRLAGERYQSRDGE